MSLLLGGGIQDNSMTGSTIINTHITTGPISAVRVMPGGNMTVHGDLTIHGSLEVDGGIIIMGGSKGLPPSVVSNETILIFPQIDGSFKVKSFHGSETHDAQGWEDLLDAVKLTAVKAKFDKAKPKT